MNNVIAFPGKPRADIEIALRQMQLLLAGKRQGSEFRSLNDEICRRQSLTDAKRTATYR
ncbi:MAG TPA: hypothetical protein VKM35_06820 [Arenimonas sp.]|uniref:hypothetical protein n=1 Tax=Arenimonas sp. TaxID=1872635 RepID=UPI002C8694DE|nr:hypothetical protein [Arenimonas sp.]HMB56906.1 hypothetical protein [Arenimonas sp.]